MIANLAAGNGDEGTRVHGNTETRPGKDPKTTLHPPAEMRRAATIRRMNPAIPKPFSPLCSRTITATIFLVLRLVSPALSAQNGRSDFALPVTKYGRGHLTCSSVGTLLYSDRNLSRLSGSAGTFCLPPSMTPRWAVGLRSKG
jgi:hypothetical protein